MKRILRKRLILSTVGMGAAAMVIGVPATIVFVNKTDNKDQIGENIKKEIETDFLKTLHILPADTNGEFDANRMKLHTENLSYYKKDLIRLEKEYAAFAKTKVPIYGMLNDVLEVSERFKNYGEFFDRVDDAVIAVNSKNWDRLEEVLFDTSNGGKNKLLSRTYGIERSEVFGNNFKIFGKISRSDYEKGVKPVSNEKITYDISNSFLSFGEYIDDLKNGVDNAEMTELAIAQLKGVFNMMMGNVLEVKSNDGLSWVDKKLKPSNIVYFLMELRRKKEVADLNPKQSIDDKNWTKMYNIWKKQMLPLWRQRYRNIEESFSNKHNPVGNYGRVEDYTTLDPFHFYESIASKDGGETTTLASVMNDFMDGKEIPGGVEKVSKGSDPATGWEADVVGREPLEGTSDRFISNWEFLRIFFGKAFEDQLTYLHSGYANGDSNPEKPTPRNTDSTQTYIDWAKYLIRKEDSGLQWSFSDLNNLMFEGYDALWQEGDSVGKTSVGYTGYQVWLPIIENIFDDVWDAKGNPDVKGSSTSYLRKELITDDPTKGVYEKISDARIWEQLYSDKDFLEAYNLVNDARNKYNTELESLQRDKFRIGVNLEEFSKMQSTYGIQDDWKIQIESYSTRYLDINSIMEIKDMLEMDQKTKKIKVSTDKYDIFDGVVYPKGEKWVLSPSDNLFIKNISLKSDSKLSKWSDQLIDYKRYQPKYKIYDDKNKVNIDVVWKITSNKNLGGWND